LKKILIFIDWFLPGYKAGGPISSNANLIEHLKDEFEFFVVTRDTDYCETTPYPGVVSNAWNTLPNGAKVYYISNSKLSFRNLIKSIKSIDYDVVYINGIYSLYFSLFPVLWFRHILRKKVVVAARGMLSDHTFSSKKEKKKLFYSLSRRLGLYKGITFHATNEEESKQIRKNVGFKGNIKVAPNLPPVIPKTAERTIKKIPGQLRLISIARISPEKNTLYALRILSNLNPQPQPSANSQQLTANSQQPTAINFDLYGTIYNQPYWQECLDMIGKLPSHITVNFCGPLEKDKIQTTLKQYHFLFMPTQGENYGHSIVESMLTGCPVIISDRTPWRHLNEIKDSTIESSNLESKGVGWDIPLEQPQHFVEIIDHCLHLDETEYAQMSLGTFHYAQLITHDDAVIKANSNLFI